MDPNEALKNLREALVTARKAADGDSNDAEIEAWQEVGEYIEALDEWLSRDGFLPTDWLAEEDKPDPIDAMHAESQRRVAHLRELRGEQ